MLLGRLKRKPKIALVVDTSNWILSYHADVISKEFSKKVNFEIIAIAEVENYQEFWNKVRKFDLVHFFSRYFLMESLKDASEKFNFFPPITFSIVDHLFLDERNLNFQANLFSKRVVNYSVSSEKLHKIYSNLESFPSPDRVLHDGVALQEFRPNMEKFRDYSDRNLRVGWVGNSNWGKSNGIEDSKGFETVMIPAIELLKNLGISVDFKVADPVQNYIKKHDMPKFYEQIDVLVCTSLHEGTPVPILEAMASNCAVISTNVGIVPEIFGELQSEYILNSRSPDELCKKLIRVNVNREILPLLAHENLQSVSLWDWRIKSIGFFNFFESNLNSRKYVF